MSSVQGTPTCVHNVTSGDTFSNLALAYYADGSNAMANKIALANPSVKPESLRVGDKLTIPAL
jgi:nucleoid-associated protein YgaU